MILAKTGNTTSTFNTNKKENFWFRPAVWFGNLHLESLD